MALPLALIFPVLSLIIIYLYRRTRSPKSSLPLPPGPKGLPLIGNIYDLPPAGAMPWQHWLTHKDAYGPLSSITVLGQVYVLINDAAVALELLRDQAAATAGRPHQVFNNDMIGWKEGLGFLQPGESFRLQRKNIAKVASAKSMIAAFDLVQEEESIHFLNNLAERPEDFLDHIRTEAGTVILRTTFGYTPRSDGRDPLVDMVAVTMANFGEAAVPGRWMVDTIPWLRYLPDWMPGTEFKRIGRRMEAQLSRTVNVPYEFVAKQLREGRSKPSYLSRAMQEDEPTPKNATVHKWAATSLYNGGSDTTVSSLMTFFLAISLFPEAQRKAQEELDRVIGGNRLPISKDKERLPYIEAIVKETHRWHPVAPMAVPHTALEETVCRGYCIPKGAMLLPNTWWITHDPAMYPDPFTFNPDRFITTPTHTAEPDPRTYTFGYGKRMCPGKYVADNALFITIAQTLSMFNISKGVENGKVIEPKLEFDPGVVSHPLPFKTTITPRSERHREVIRRAQELHPYGESDAKELENLDTTFAV